MPDTDSVSWVMTVISAVASWALAVMARRLAPTNRVSTKKTGTVATATSVSCHDSTSMAISVLRRMTELEMVSDTVDVTTVCTPATSLDTLDCTSPVRVLLKNRIDMPCRWR